ncbi:MAG: hypothetical protein ACOYBD_12080 [Bilifractor sp.]
MYIVEINHFRNPPVWNPQDIRFFSRIRRAEPHSAGQTAPTENRIQQVKLLQQRTAFSMSTHIQQAKPHPQSVFLYHNPAANFCLCGEGTILHTISLLFTRSSSIEG